MPFRLMPAWAAVGSQTRMPVVTVVMAASSHLRMRRFMIHLLPYVDGFDSRSTTWRLGGRRQPPQRRVAQSTGITARPAWAIVGRQTRMPVGDGGDGCEQPPTDATVHDSPPIRRCPWFDTDCRPDGRLRDSAFSATNSVLERRVARQAWARPVRNGGPSGSEDRRSALVPVSRCR
jgi:hypothetical protein